MNVNIYIETAFKGPVKRRTAGAWIVEYVAKSGQPVTRGGMLYTDLATEQEMSIFLIKQAFSILTKTCCVRVFTHCQGILGTMQNHWLWQWRKNGWNNSKGKPVKNAHMWEQCADLIEKHITEWTDEEQAAGLTQQQMADKLGISIRHYKYMEAGKIVGNVELWDKLEDIAGIHQRKLREIG